MFAAALLGLQGSYPSEHRWFVVLAAPALVLRRFRSYLRDFVPLALLVLAYEWLRTGAHRLDPSPYYRPQIDADTVLGLGRVPSVWLQQQLYGGRPGALDRTLSVVHSLHFAVPMTLLFAVWLVSRPEYVRAAAAFVTTAYLALIGFVLFPAAPPWLAASHGLIGPLTRIRAIVVPSAGALPQSLTRRLFDDNPVAAIPSLHGAWSLLVVLVVWRVWPRARWLALCYAIVQQFAVVYLGEHYVIDVLLGDVLALGVWWAVGRVLGARAPGAPRPR